MKIRMATRSSRLALNQTRSVAAWIRKQMPHAEIVEVPVQTRGDKVVDRPLAEIGGKALFVSEVERCVIEGDADLAVHSLKDIPGDVPLPDGMELMCFPEREAAHDVLLTPDSSELEALEAGGSIGTCSPRRVAQLRLRRPDMRFETLRGNVETRLRRLDEGRYQGIVLAAAGLRRLGLLDARAHWPIPIDLCLPAVGQGILAIEAPSERSDLREILQGLEHESTRLAAEAERSFLKALQGNCHVPIAALARVHDDGARLSLDAFVASSDNGRTLSGTAERYLRGRERENQISTAQQLGAEVAASLIEQGARKIIVDAAMTKERHARQGNGHGPDGDRYKWGR